MKNTIKIVPVLSALCLLLLSAIPATAVAGGGGARTPGMFGVYEQNRTEGISNYITEDFLLLAYSMIRQETGARVEEKVLMPALTTLVLGLKAGGGKEASPVAIANRDFVAILDALLHGKGAVEGAGDPKRAGEELALILGAGGIARSPLWEKEIDYSQFLPRGPYTDTPARKAYFRAFRYASGILFHLKESRATGVSAAMANRMTGQALALMRFPMGGLTDRMPRPLDVAVR